MHGPQNVKYGNGCRKSLLRQNVFNIRFISAKLSNQMTALADIISQHAPLVHLVGLLNFPFISGTADSIAAHTFGTNRHAFSDGPNSMFHVSSSLANFEGISTGRQNCNFSSELYSDSWVHLTSPLRKSMNYIPLLC
jgi:hypothetical protein